jgi:hypothetical protein
MTEQRQWLFMTRFGEYFCSEEHVNQYMKQIEKEGKSGKWSKARHGCC